MLPQCHTRCAGVLALLLAGVPWARAGAATLIVLNKSEGSASLLDTASGQEVARVPTGEAPHEVAVAPDGGRAVVSNYGPRGKPGNTLTVFDVAAARVVETIDLGEYTRPHGVAWFADGRRIAVTAEGKKVLLVVDVDAGKIESAIDTGQDVSHMVVLTRDEKRAFVANISSGSVTAIDLEKKERLANIPIAAGTEGITLTRDDDFLWVTSRDADRVTVLDARTLAIVDTLACASFPIRAQASPDGRYVLVTTARSGEVVAFDAVRRREHYRVRMDLAATETHGRLFGAAFANSSVPIGILVTPDSKLAYVAHANADVVSVLDIENWKVVGTLRAGKEPDGLGFSEKDVAPEARTAKPVATRQGSAGSSP
jgi:DNA-binding beta-propeller fold protein YncE